jgi:hypothetical protein
MTFVVQKAVYLLLPEEHNRNHLVAGLFQRSPRLDYPLFCLLTSALTMPLGKGVFARSEAKTSWIERVDGMFRVER